MKFDGSDYDPKYDDFRLRGQISRVFTAMKNGKWYTLDQINKKTKDPHASISAQLRHLRKAKFGSHTIDKRPKGNRLMGLWEYRLTVNERKKDNESS